MSIISLSREKCVGCESCAGFCPTSAISMAQDQEGFCYPQINEGMCIGCRKCEEVCPVMNRVSDQFSMDEPKYGTYAGWALNSTTRENGSSGGIFSVLAQAVIEKNGCVVGAAYTKEYLAEHRIICKTSQLGMLKKSKYLQSRCPQKLYRDLQKILSQGRLALFTGTPCQCAALLSGLGKQPENLILCDVVCFGINSPKVHQRYIRELGEKLGQTVVGVDHRSKVNGWRQYAFTVKTNSKDEFSAGGKRENPFLRGFLTGLYLRPSCYTCPFKGMKHPTDLTLGDCWGYPGQEEKGVSCIFAHTLKGKQLLQEIREQIHIELCDPKTVLQTNKGITQCAADRFDRRAEFYQCFLRGETVEEIILKLLGH